MEQGGTGWYGVVRGGIGYRVVQGTGYRGGGDGLRTLQQLRGTEYRVQDTEYRVQGTGYRLQATAYRLQRTGYRLYRV